MKKLRIPAFNRFLANEQRAGNVLIFGAAGVAAVCCVLGIAAVVLLR
ncbi:hypothetical protein [Ramlibacter alkalitolerans]|uniref:Uncharacterized protein n=1 Tax=Ramlibacter alkalitolerans TaxID=2039631 RepID=A0ABS1JTV9_9BURK|nr:hypothetical protein [Ramlibacter alkalitolerans]MBL0427663.1 hypothetical protein [Ramlibacter alkalitolerans]